jgi:hypothetical protein
MSLDKMDRANGTCIVFVFIFNGLKSVATTRYVRYADFINFLTHTRHRTVFIPLFPYFR